MDASFIQWLLGQTGIAGIAGLALYMLQRTYKDAMAREQEISKQSREDRAHLMSVLTELTKALSSLQSAVETSSYEQKRRRDQSN